MTKLTQLLLYKINGCQVHMSYKFKKTLLHVFCVHCEHRFIFYLASQSAGSVGNIKGTFPRNVLYFFPPTNSIGGEQNGSSDLFLRPADQKLYLMCWF